MAIEFMDEHKPVLVYANGPGSTPTELCAACSDDSTDKWVAVTGCAITAANQLPDGAPVTDVAVLSPPCTSCGRRDQMTRWEDPYGTGWQCHALDCLQMTTDGEDE